MKMKVKCSKCSYEWETKSKLNFVTCPNCQLKFRIKVLKGGIKQDGRKDKSSN